MKPSKKLERVITRIKSEKQNPKKLKKSIISTYKGRITKNMTNGV